MTSLIPLFWTFGNVCLKFQNYLTCRCLIAWVILQTDSLDSPFSVTPIDIDLLKTSMTGRYLFSLTFSSKVFVATFIFDWRFCTLFSNSHGITFTDIIFDHLIPTVTKINCLLLLINSLLFSVKTQSWIDLLTIHGWRSWRARDMKAFLPTMRKQEKEHKFGDI